MLSVVAYVFTMDMFGLIANNVGRIIEMSQQPKSVRKISDVLDRDGSRVGRGVAAALPQPPEYLAGVG